MQWNDDFNDSFLHPPWLHCLLTVGINDYFMVEEQLSRTLFCFGIFFQVRAARSNSCCCCRPQSFIAEPIEGRGRCRAESAEDSSR